MSKGSGRRPASVSDAELAARWAVAFGRSTGKVHAQMASLGIDLQSEMDAAEAEIVIKSDTPDSEK